MNVYTTEPRAETTIAPVPYAAPRSVGPKYPPHDRDAHLLEGIDIVGVAAAVIITLGPLAAYSLGLGA